MMFKENFLRKNQLKTKKNKNEQNISRCKSQKEELSEPWTIEKKIYLRSLRHGKFYLKHLSSKTLQCTLIVKTTKG